MGVSKNRGTPKSSILRGFSIIFTIHFGGSIHIDPPLNIHPVEFQHHPGHTLSEPALGGAAVCLGQHVSAGMG